MKNLDFRQLTSDGFVIAIEPPALNDFPAEAIKISFATYTSGEKIEPINQVQMVKLYHDCMVVIPIGGGFSKYNFRDLFYQGRGRVLIESTKDNELWCLDWRASSTMLIRYGVIHNDDSNDELIEKEAIVFIGCERGREEIIRTEGNAEVSNLCSMLSHYTDHYEKLLGAISKS